MYGYWGKKDSQNLVHMAEIIFAKDSGRAIKSASKEFKKMYSGVMIIDFEVATIEGTDFEFSLVGGKRGKVKWK